MHQAPLLTAVVVTHICQSIERRSLAMHQAPLLTAVVVTHICHKERAVVVWICRRANIPTSKSKQKCRETGIFGTSADLCDEDQQTDDGNAIE
jgi:hypothetical protein